MPAAAIYDIAESATPKEEMLNKIGDLSDIQIGGGRVLVWTYIRSKRTKGGIILTDKEVKEDVWQGLVGYVLKAGPLAFKNDATHDFGGFAAKVGDWVVFSPGAAPRRQINGVDCRIIEDANIEMVIPDPELITHRQ